TRFSRGWSSDVCSSDLLNLGRDLVVVRVVGARGGQRQQRLLGLLQILVVGRRHVVANAAGLAIALEGGQLLLAVHEAEQFPGLRSEERRVGKVCSVGVA